MQLELNSKALKERKPEADAVVASEPGTDHNDGLWGTAVPIMIGAYGIALAIVAYTFWESGDALLSIAICAVYVIMIFGVPMLMARVRNRHDVRWDPDSSEATTQRVSVFNGSIGRAEAVLQMVIVPIAIAFAFAAFATIWLTVKP